MALKGNVSMAFTHWPRWEVNVKESLAVRLIEEGNEPQKIWDTWQRVCWREAAIPQNPRRFHFLSRQSKSDRVHEVNQRSNEDRRAIATAMASSKQQTVLASQSAFAPASASSTALVSECATASSRSVRVQISQADSASRSDYERKAQLRKGTLAHWRMDFLRRKIRQVTMRAERTR